MKTYSIGRNPQADIILTSNLCSRDHAKLTVSETSKIVLQDFSSNGTTVNGKKITNQTTEVKQGDEILFAGIEKLDWNILDVPKAAPLPPPLPNFIQRNGLKIGVSAVVFIILLFGGFGLKTNWNELFPGDTLTATDIYNRYQKSVVLVEVTYFIHVKTVAGNMYFGFDENGKITANKKQSELKPFSSQGTAFFTDNKGTLATNKHVVLPWKNETISNYFFRNVEPTIKRILREKGWTDTKIDIEAEGQRYYIYPNGSRYSSVNRIECELQNVSQNEDIDLATLRTKTNALPQNSTFIASSETEVNEQKIEVGSPAFVVSFPYGDELAKNESDEINCTVTAGSFTQTPAKNYVQYSAQVASGSSGSPVFNQYGKLVAVTYKGSTTGQSFNRGILGKYLKKIL